MEHKKLVVIPAEMTYTKKKKVTVDSKIIIWTETHPKKAGRDKVEVKGSNSSK